MILSFNPRFVEPILNGTKIHTLRLDPTDRWEKDRHIHFATGVRTKNYQCFKEGKCISTQDIFMTYAYNDILEITLDGRYVWDWKVKEQIALNDGFESYTDFFEWFVDAIEDHPEKHFSGKIIHWTDFRYISKEVQND